MKTFFFFGDSITLGVNDVAAGGWVGRLAGLAAAAGLPVPPSTFYNLGARRHSSRHIRQRWLAEYRARLTADTSPYLLFCFGTVDMAAPNGNVVVPPEESLANARAILEEARGEAPLLLISAPPVKNPEHGDRIAALDKSYAALCESLNLPYADIFAELGGAYIDDLSDGLHPGETGNRLMAECLLRHPTFREWIRP